MSRIAYVNGRYLPHGQASVHVEDRGYQFADGVYEVVYFHDNRLIDRDLHLDRLERSLGELRIPAPIGRAALIAVLHELASRNRRQSGIFYLQITRGVARRAHPFPPAGTRPSLVAILYRTPPFPKNLDRWTGSAITLRDERWARCDIKSTALLPNVLARQAAREQGALEALLIDADGMVTEGAATSVWIVGADGVLRTRPLSNAILPGCTRAALLGELSQSGIAMEERGVSLAELRSAREVFITAASIFVKPILSIDGRQVGDGKVGPVATQLFDLFARHVYAGSNGVAR